MWMKASFSVVVTLFLVSPAVAEEAPETSARPLDTLIAQAEQHFYDLKDPNRLEKTDAVLDQIQKSYPEDPYSYWAHARSTFFKKEDFYTTQEGETPEKVEKAKLELAEKCHDYTDKCIEVSRKTPECYLLKGSCYAMQASTWGVGRKSLRVCKPMDDAWAKAIRLPSSFRHAEGVTTAQLARILRAILYRIMPDRWWFRFLSGVRGSKEKAYRWMKDSAQGSLLAEPMVVIERAATAICYGRAKKKPELVVEGMKLLEDGLKLPTRYPTDDFDKRNMQILMNKPEESCDYRRERFEDLSEEGIAKKVK